MKIGNRIKELRTKRGLTQEALASALGVTPQTVSKWECEVNFPDVSLLPDLSVFFGVSIDSLFSMTRSDKFERIGNRISEGGLLSEDEVKQIEGILKEYIDEADEAGEAKVLLAKLYDHQADECRKIAAEYAKDALEETEASDEALKEIIRSHEGATFGVIENSHRELIIVLQDYLSRNPESSSVTAMLIDNLIAEGRIAEAKLWAEHLDKIDSSYIPLGYKYAIASVEGKEDVAAAAIALLSNVYPDNPDAMMLLADIYFSREEYDKAIGCCIKASERYPVPRPIKPAVVAAHIAELLGNLDDAVLLLREAQRILKEEWGVVSGERADAIRREIKRISAQ